MVTPLLPWMLGLVKTSINALEMSLRGQTRGPVCVGSIYPMKYYEARNRIHARNGRSRPLLVCIDLLALLYILHAYTMCCFDAASAHYLRNGPAFFSLSSCSASLFCFCSFCQLCPNFSAASCKFGFSAYTNTILNFSSFFLHF